MKNISASELLQKIAAKESIDLIDVRTPVEYRSMHVAIARNIPLDRLDPQAIQTSRSAATAGPLYVVCRSGGRSRQACEKLISAGVTNVVNVEGGTMACASAGVPMVRGKKSVPLNCQVQIITGFLVLAGALVALATGNLYWLSLPIVMGAGLMFSGITDTCAMGAVLAYMPWNQVKAEPTSDVSATSGKCQEKNITSCCN